MSDNITNDTLLANLNAFKNKVKSSSNISSLSGDTGNNHVNNAKGFRSNGNSPQKKRLLSQMRDENRRVSNIKRETGVASTPVEIISDEDDDEDSPSTDSINKKVRPGSIAAAALQASQSNLSKSHDSSKLLWATEYIQKKGKPVPKNELMDYLSLTPNDKLLDLLKKLDKIEYDPKKNSYKYLSTYDVHSGPELIKLLKAQVTFKGISCKELKDGWPQCDEIINKLEEESKILVLRTKKDRAPRYVWNNNGGDLHRIDEQFIKMWGNVQLPQFSELPRKLQDLGLKPASVDPASIKKNTTVEIKKRKQRKGKVTNTHMAGILKDYSHRV